MERRAALADREPEDDDDALVVAPPPPHRAPRVEPAQSRPSTIFPDVRPPQVAPHHEQPARGQQEVALPPLPEARVPIICPVAPQHEPELGRSEVADHPREQQQAAKREPERQSVQVPFRSWTLPSLKRKLKPQRDAKLEKAARPSVVERRVFTETDPDTENAEVSAADAAAGAPGLPGDAVVKAEVEAVVVYAYLVHQYLIFIRYYLILEKKNKQ